MLPPWRVQPGLWVARATRAIVALVAIAVAAGAVAVTLRAGFLVYPGWLALQKADLILGPVLIGLYWARVRPASRFGWMLVAYGAMCAGYARSRRASRCCSGSGSSGRA